MKIRKFEAETVSDALRAIREELGPEAVILSTREMVPPRSGGDVRPKIEVTAGVEWPSPFDAPAGKDAPRFENILKEVMPRLEAGEEILSLREEVGRIKEVLESLCSSRQLDRNRIYGRLYEVFRESGGISDRTPWRGEKVPFHASFVRLFDRLLSSGVDHQTAIGLVRLMSEKIAPGEAGQEDLLEIVLEEVIRMMFQKISSASIGDPGPVVTAVVGPSGTGKTTTLAKLAARRAISHQKGVLATLDVSRVGAVDQLNAFGRIIGMPVFAASSFGELNRFISGRKPGDVVFLDTPGRNVREIRQFTDLNRLKKGGLAVETHLVLTAHMREEEVDEMIEEFSLLSADRIIFTKTDETRRFGHLLSILRRKKKSISYLATGQRVPEDLEVATPRRMTELILKENPTRASKRVPTS